MIERHEILVVGAGIFGITAALALKRRGHQVAVLDPGPLPHPLAASRDISKVVRMEYGADEDYMALVEAARQGWLRWNELFGEPLYHETGVLMLARQPMTPGGYEYESYRLLQERGHRPERMDSLTIARRFPAWNASLYVDGFYHAEGGWAESGRVVARLIELAQEEGVILHAGQTVEGFIEDGAAGVTTAEGTTFHAEQIVIAAGAWTPLLIPELASAINPVGQPVFHLRPADPSLFEANHFPVFTADVAQTGWYGFPLHPREGVVKIANHGVGRHLDPSTGERRVTEEQEAALRDFLANTFPALADAPIVYTRLCLYSDTLDQHFWIDRHPTRPALVVASGGSGHGFKFGPVLGDLIADAVEGVDNPYLPKFQWRSLGPDTVGQEAARHRL